MSIQDAVREYGITKVVHFTTNLGLLGIIATGAVKSRQRLPEEKYVEHIYTPNCKTRYDDEWLDYVNLSITTINTRLYDIASNKWHAAQDLWWCVLEFDPVILEQEGVVFVTTNNMYSGAQRAQGEAGLRALFAPRVHQYLGNYATRSPRHDAYQPTCYQAEVLYPGQVSTEYLRRVVFYDGMHADTAMAQCGVLRHSRPECVIDPEVFR